MKIVTLLKRKPGMTMEEFVAYYENVHAKLGEKYLITASRYIRHYFHPLPYVLNGIGEIGEPEYDVMTEVFFDNQDDHDTLMEMLRDPVINKIFADDEENLFDRSKSRTVLVQDRESKLR